MKIIKPKPEPERRLDHDAWIAKFKELTGATWVPTGYLDAGAVVRFEFPCGAVAEWHWQDQTPEKAAQEVVDAGIVEIQRVEIRLEQTCFACPEQYDAFVGDRQVGYLRLRHGSFTVECPDVGGEQVFRGFPRGDGCFDEEERERFLDEAKSAISGWLRRVDSEEPGEDLEPDPCKLCGQYYVND